MRKLNNSISIDQPVQTSKLSIYAKSFLNESSSTNLVSKTPLSRHIEKKVNLLNRNSRYDMPNESSKTQMKISY